MRAIELAEVMLGVSAFHNISPSDKTKYAPKFSPTIFDSVLIAIDSAIVRKINPIESPKDRKFELLMDSEYKSAISQETMRKNKINLRINKACQYLFGVDYE